MLLRSYGYVFLVVGTPVYFVDVTRPVRTGLDELAADPALLHRRRFALLANQAAVTADLEPAWSALASRGAEPVRLFAPEHGLWGVAQDMEAVSDLAGPEVAVPVHSLYGAEPDSLTPAVGLLEDLDAVVVDLPDIGCRYYTFAATMAYLMAACERVGVEVIVCDRPNPVGGVALEGGPVEEGLRSFVSELPTPVRHGLTLGEIALLLQARRHPDLTLTVVPCSGWRRGAWWDETGLPWVAPSPNMPTLITAAVYPGACLVEATTLSEGRGTTRPFRLVGAPWLAGAALAARLNALEPPGARFASVLFRPEFGKHAGAICSGVEWHVTDRCALRSLETGLRLLAEVRSLHPDRFAWRAEPYEFVTRSPAIDLLSGSLRARAVVEGAGDIDRLLGDWRAHCEGFRSERRPFLLYPEAE
jgi:uncharacterized protein YbbC (DUF1343 family)